jgi:UV DNA damage repair endonuclease
MGPALPVLPRCGGFRQATRRYVATLAPTARTAYLGHLARTHDVRLSFHPDQFVALNSVRDDVVASSVRELDAHASLGLLIGVDTITLHVGGMTGGKEATLERLEANLAGFSGDARARLALENDDRLFTVSDLEPPNNFPREWPARTITVDVEAKAKDAAIQKLREALRDDRRGTEFGGGRRGTRRRQLAR